MPTHLQGDRLPEWIAAASATAELPSLRHFAQHLLRDLDAATAGLTLPWNSGVMEGHVSRIKRCSSARCSAAQVSISYANGFYWRDRASPDHKKWTRAASHPHHHGPEPKSPARPADVCGYELDGPPPGGRRAVPGGAEVGIRSVFAIRTVASLSPFGLGIERDAGMYLLP